ncbi:hypothetical protein JAO29_09955 [Edaphobacter sp. HDX4]|uniref:hypothetical protein n=1 Tax=Edaphobacter sp. HDX4 TaxID=2794064 RepID=UPI002FE6A309
MPEVEVAEGMKIDSSVGLRKDSPLAKAGLKKLLPASANFAQNLSLPVDLIQIRSLATAADFESPDQLSDNSTSLIFKGDVNCEVSIRNHNDGCVFEDDGFSPKIEIGQDEVWVGVEVDSLIQAKVKAKANGLGVSVGVQTGADLITYSRIAKGQNGFPKLQDAIIEACSKFGVLLDAASIRSQAPGTVRITDTNGSVTIAASAELPVDLDAFASLRLPLDTPFSIAPSVTLEVTASLKLEGDLVVRCYRVDADTCQLGVYRKRGSTLKLSLDAGAGVSATAKDKDLLAQLLSKAFNASGDSGLSSTRYKELSKIFGDAVDRSLSIAMSASFSSSDIHEAAFLVSVNLRGGEPFATDQAMNAALHGDWTLLANLAEKKQNVTLLRDLTVETTSKKGLIQINLLGFYTFEQISSYLQTSTVLIDENGDLTITDEATAKDLKIVGKSYAEARDQLSKAMMDSFIATAVYKVIGSGLNLDINVSQCYFDYANSMSRNRMLSNLLLVYTLGTAQEGSLDYMLDDPRWLDHVAFTATVTYKNADLMALFFKDSALMTQWGTDELMSLARKTLASLIRPETNLEKARILALQTPEYWAELYERPAGNYAASEVLPSLIKQYAVAVHVDWMEITDWVKAILNVGKALADTLKVMSSSKAKDPRKDPNFKDARKNLANRLGSLAKSNTGTLTRTWGELVQFALSGQRGTVAIDIEAASQTRHLGKAAKA